ncbi:bifunctional diaminohydroxyphosphoribosylaminopyrimidine deaminase/5-amino-6-(5-phosphoribosylamino)uracil reductase RibD [Ligilactobacillus acidipiscis]|uniref:bifunctional diaminohydroxyphosphoribosylaminopyrimidine deaminase/5-amino-6-(5-phosphoribosylamino)uracil reductase RibD n=1 Tax=Ligilactobacillus acidipiscis TaxID=89059 RepID=UPI0023F9AB7A|nr:bifunctional diaminohydroxyphosphoribosylaminopyrimidine deaminase/5-amino-6-(5-phosphoribosylamino)uracil reductase RibD [Ligilactobacillus acidipiscis]WEV58193.1 bifunctional diaminohydroxyphosphoribosylaminopyrimidine deaminase/5-amino-6-(5-phosphoribosylamino)uracil reductase RibD [Ligilactobacillus acidipiscis]
MKDSDYMQLAVKAAWKGWGQTWTNPLVGAVIVKDNQVLAIGYHHRFGQHHAEVDALTQLTHKNDAHDATLYVTLEPCSHYGKQPPCVEKVVHAGIKRVVIGQVDPNPLVGGKGLSYLKEHQVETVLLGQSYGLNSAYNFYYQNKRPLITLKYAMTLDGKINQTSGDRAYLTDTAAYQDSQKLRVENQAILIGNQTLRVDDPLLTVRKFSLFYPPIRIILAHDADQLDFKQSLFTKPGPVWALCNHCTRNDLPNNVEIFVQNEWTPARVIHFLGQKNIQSLLVEGGSHTHAEFVGAGLVDKVVTYIAPKIFGGEGLPAVFGKKLAQADELEITQIQLLGPDLRIEARRK